ncbi:AEC family transporter [cf. Phormidesmis sp. LEGE 11477]|uniref:AEC family transporter n=1 Tax=cf. Phormidesmis sp. LEGE 11477 TaxID=1828680 RepID=UPI0018802D15|nr:AEC family transporter [cf. Phormidesmis sp. LEGE 11477]
MGVVISAVLPIALVALCGVWVGRAFSLDIKTLTRLNIYVLLPALVLTGVYGSSLEIGVAARIVAGFLLNCGVLYGVAIALSKKLQLPTDTQKSLVATTLLANTGNIGLPFILFALGEAALERAIIYLVASAIFITSVGPTFLKGQGIRAGLKITFNLPVFWATLAGIGLQISMWKVPLAIDRGLELMAEAAIPVALLILGIQLSRIPLKIGLYELIATALRLVVSPLSAYGIGQLLRLEGIDLAVLVMQASMPVAVNTLIWVTEFGGDTARVARTIVLSTLLSFATLPVVLWLVVR